MIEKVTTAKLQGKSWRLMLLAVSCLLVPVLGSGGLSRGATPLGEAVDQALSLYRSGVDISGEQWSGLRQQLLQDPEAKLARLQEPLRAEDPDTRRAVIELLFQIRGRTATDLLISALRSDPSPANRLAALERLVATSQLLEVCRLLAEEVRGDGAGGSLELVTEAVETLRHAEGVASSEGARSWPRSVVRWATAGDPEAINQGVRRVITEAIGDSTVQLEGGVRVLTRPRANAAQRGKVLRLGPAAIPALADYAWSNNPAEWEVARRLLVEVGNGRAVEPLARVVREHPEPHRRKQALTTLMDASRFSTVADALVSVARSDPDPDIRSLAGGLVAAMRRELGLN